MLLHSRQKRIILLKTVFARGCNKMEKEEHLDEDGGVGASVRAVRRYGGAMWMWARL